MEKTLVWLTHSFRTDSRLMSKLSGPCTFVYYSPYYFADRREKEILKNCSKQNLEAFYESLSFISNELKNKGHNFYVFKESNPIEHINSLVAKYKFNRVVIDLPLFGMWKSIDPMEISVPFSFIDSDLIDDECFKMTAKSRWMHHAKTLDKTRFHKFNSSIEPFSINEKSKSYPKFRSNLLLNMNSIISRISYIVPTYGQTRDSHEGQTRLSTAFQNGIIDPANLFCSVMSMFTNADFSKNEGPHASMLRQFAFREMTIIQTRRSGLTMEDYPLEWAKHFLTEKSYENLITKTNENSELTFDKIKNAKTGDSLVDKILVESFKVGVMPNRARMFFAGWLFYNSPTGKQALNWLIDTFDLLLLDGQCPTNYMQSVSCMNLQYGKVMLLNRNRVTELLNYKEYETQH